jgi:GDSL-like Lipase/Acylhydrolase family
MRGKYVNYILVLVSSLIGVLAGETVLRIAGFHGVKDWTVADVLYVENSVLNYRLRPNSLSTDGKITYQLNDQGFRDLKRQQEKASSVYRVLVLGDSVAFGYKVEFQRIFSRRLEVLLRQFLKSKTLEVVTLAMPGLNTIQESALLLEKGKQYEPDAVVLAFVLNDADAGSSFQVKKDQGCRIEILSVPAPCAMKHLMKESAFLYFLKEGLDELMWRFDVSDKDDPQGSIRSDYFSKLYRDDGKWRSNVVEGFQEIADFALTRGIPVIVVIFPVMFDFDKYQWDWIHSKVAKEALNYRFLIVDLLAEYRRYPVKQTRIERGDFVHPNALGHEVAAISVARFFYNGCGSKGKQAKHCLGL